MTEAEAYIEVAERALLAAEGALNKLIQEKGAFLAYHAFECTGGAFCRSRGTLYPQKHRAKINTFVSAAKKEKYGKAVSRLAIELINRANIVAESVTVS